MTRTVPIHTPVKAFPDDGDATRKLTIAPNTKITVYEIFCPHGVVRVVAGGSDDPIASRPEYDPVNHTFMGYQVVRIR